MIKYERYCKIRDIRNLKDSQVAALAGIGKSTLSDWKSGRSKPKDDKMKKIAIALNVTVEYLNMEKDIIVCPVCGFGNNPLSEQSEKEHEQFHNNFLSIKEKYPFFLKYSDADKTRSESISNFRNPNKTFEEKISCFDNCLKASFSLEIARNNYDISNLNYEDFCKSEVSTLKPDWTISEELIDILIEKYGVDKEYMYGDEELLARVSNNPQLMRILSCAEKLSPELLNAIELQIKALIDNKSEG